MMKTSKSNLDYPSIAILFAILFLSAVYLQISGWASDLDNTGWSLALGFCVGILSSKIKNHSAAKKLMYGSFVSVTLFVLIFSASSFQSGKLIERMTLLLINNYNEVNLLIKNHPLDTSYLFIFAICFVFTAMGFLSGFCSMEKNNYVFGTVAASIVFIAVDLLLPTEKQSWVLTAVFFSLVTYLAIHRFIHRKKIVWSKATIGVEGTTRLDSNWVILAACIIISGFSWAVPSMVQNELGIVQVRELNTSLKNIEGPIKNFTSALQNSESQVQTTYPKRYVIGRSISNSDDVVFTVRADQLMPTGYNYYWRGRSYDFYSDGTWSNTDSFETNTLDLYLNMDEAIEEDDLRTFQIHVRQPLWTYYTVGEIAEIDQDARLLVIREMDDSVTVAGIFPAQEFRAGEKYSFSSLVRVPPEEILKNATDSYPEWVTARYLQLPENLPARVEQLAFQITNSMQTPYEKVMAVTEYLRSNIAYSEFTQQVPVERDLVDWLLFDSKKGFCAYYATAEVVLLRSVGIPARLSIGFAEGIEQDRGRSFIVREKDSHAWPEVFFADTGWVVFEPTSSLPRQLFSSSVELNTMVDESSTLELFPGVTGEAAPLLQPIESGLEDSTLEGQNQAEYRYIFLWIILAFVIGIIIYFFVVLIGLGKKWRIRSINQFILNVLKLNVFRNSQVAKKWIEELETPRVVIDFQKVIRCAKNHGVTFPTSATEIEQVDLLVSSLPAIDVLLKPLLTEYLNVVYRMQVKRKYPKRYSIRKIKNLIIFKKEHL